MVSNEVLHDKLRAVAGDLTHVQQVTCYYMHIKDNQSFGSLVLLLEESERMTHYKLPCITLDLRLNCKALFGKQFLFVWSISRQP